MRNVDNKNQIWYMSEGNVTSIGFTKSFIESLDQCWQILPANMRTFKKKSPMMMVETNDALISIMAPVSGNLQHFNNIARDFPDHLTEDTVIMRVVDGVPAAQAEAVQVGINVPQAPFVLQPGRMAAENLANAEWHHRVAVPIQQAGLRIGDVEALGARQQAARELMQRRELERAARRRAEQPEEF